MTGCDCVCVRVCVFLGGAATQQGSSDKGLGGGLCLFCPPDED